MSIASVVLRGYGNGTVIGAIALVVVRGYTLTIPVVSFVAADPDHTAVLDAENVTDLLPAEDVTQLLPAEVVTTIVRAPKT